MDTPRGSETTLPPPVTGFVKWTSCVAMIWPIVGSSGATNQLPSSESKSWKPSSCTGAGGGGRKVAFVTLAAVVALAEAFEVAFATVPSLSPSASV